MFALANTGSYFKVTEAMRNIGIVPCVPHTLQAALDAAKTEAAAAKASAEQAVAKANSAESTATEAEKAAAQAALDAANAKAEAIKAAQDEVAKVKAELEAAIDSKFEAEKEALARRRYRYHDL